MSNELSDDKLITLLKKMDRELHAHYIDYTNAEISKDDKQWHISFGLYSDVSCKFNLLMDIAHERDIL